MNSDLWLELLTKIPEAAQAAVTDTSLTGIAELAETVVYGGLGLGALSLIGYILITFFRPG